MYPAKSIICLIFLAIVLSLVSSASISQSLNLPKGYAPKVYNVSLDDPLEKRWQTIIKDHMQPLDHFLRELDMLPIPETFYKGVEWYAKNMFKHQDFVAEVEVVSKLSGFPFQKLFFVNFLYEFVTARPGMPGACTGILLCNSAGEVLHGRNMDFELMRLISKLVVRIEFYRGGKHVYHSDVIVGAVFTYTGSVPGAFGLEINTRFMMDFSKDLISILIMDNIPSCWLARRVLEEETTYRSAVERLKHQSVSSPVYYIVSGTQPYQATVIEKDINGYHAYYELSEINWFIVQTNHDRDVPDPVNDPRRTAVEHRLRERGNDDFTLQELFEEYMSVIPSHHPLTIYTSMIVPKQGYHNTTVWYKVEQTEETKIKKGEEAVKTSID